MLAVEAVLESAEAVEVERVSAVLAEVSESDVEQALVAEELQVEDILVEIGVAVMRVEVMDTGTEAVLMQSL
jgi:hypothetical protein